MELFCISGTCSLSPHILLEEIGEPFTVKLLDRDALEQKTPEYLAINPKGKVPALRVDGDVITENVAIQTFLADRYSDRALAPTDPLGRAQWLGYLAWLSTTVHAYFRRFFRPGLYSEDEAAHASIAAAGRSNFLDSIAMIDEQLAGQEWIFGDQFTTADIYTHVFHSWAHVADFPVAELVNLKRHGDAMMGRPSTQAAFEREGISLELMA
ncbi:MAG: glutathione S-transferase N-terminal domain-containing protein [Pseudomonadota bacterium]